MKNPMTVIMEVDLKEWADKFMSDINSENGIIKNENIRKLAFDWVHKLFVEKRTDKDSYDNIAVHLYSYLACWGMIDYQKPIMQCNYKVLANTVKYLCEKADIQEYNFLINYNPFEHNKPEEKQRYAKTLKRLADEIRLQLNHDIHMVKTDREIRVSNTFISKILLATFGCIPAMDSHFTKILVRNRCNSGLNEEFLMGLYDYALQNSQLKNMRYKGVVDYPIMKIIDMAFWEYGS